MGLFKKYRQKIRMVKSLRKYYRRGNRLTLVGADGNQIVNPKYFTGLKIKSCGTGNDITIELPINIEKYLILVLTDNTTVRIGRNTRFGEPSNICKSRGTPQTMCILDAIVALASARLTSLITAMLKSVTIACFHGESSLRQMTRMPSLTRPQAPF